MLGEKETETQIPDMSQIEDVDDAIRILFGVPPRGRKLLFTRMKRRATDSKFNLGHCTDPQYDFLVYRASKENLHTH